MHDTRIKKQKIQQYNSKREENSFGGSDKKSKMHLLAPLTMTPGKTNTAKFSNTHTVKTILHALLNLSIIKKLQNTIALMKN